MKKFCPSQQKRDSHFAKAIGFLILLFTATSSLPSLGQSCCLTDTLIISTGYDPVGDTARALTSIDAKWKMIGLSPDCALLSVSPITAFDVAGGLPLPPGGIPYNYISYTPTGCYAQPFVGEVDSMTVQRCFYLCHAGTVTLDFWIADDDYVSSLLLNGVAIGAPDFPQTVAPGAGDVAARHVSLTRVLNAGQNCITATIHNWYYLMAYQCFNFGLNGTVSCTDHNIFKETGSCGPSWPYCVEPPIRGVNQCCVGQSETLTDSLPGGVWSSSNNAIGTIGPATGIYTGISGGLDTILYTDACGRVVTYPITINPLPSVITGVRHVCVGGTTTLSDSVGGGVWHSDNTSIATITASGIVTGISPGVDTITYTLTSTGCVRTTTVTVNPLPAAITGPDVVCVGSSITLADGTTGGTWTSSTPTIATITPVTGIVTGVSPGGNRMLTS